MGWGLVEEKESSAPQPAPPQLRRSTAPLSLAPQPRPSTTLLNRALNRVPQLHPQPRPSTAPFSHAPQPRSSHAPLNHDPQSRPSTAPLSHDPQPSTSAAYFNCAPQPPPQPPRLAASIRFNDKKTLMPFAFLRHFTHRCAKTLILSPFLRFNTRKPNYCHSFYASLDENINTASLFTFRSAKTLILFAVLRFSGCLQCRP